MPLTTDMFSGRKVTHHFLRLKATMNFPAIFFFFFLLVFLVILDAADHPLFAETSPLMSLTLPSLSVPPSTWSLSSFWAPPLLKSVSQKLAFSRDQHWVLFTSLTRSPWAISSTPTSELSWLHLLLSLQNLEQFLRRWRYGPILFDSQIKFLFYYLFLAAVRALWDFSSPTRDQTQALSREGSES